MTTGIVQSLLGRSHGFNIISRLDPSLFGIGFNCSSTLEQYMNIDTISTKHLGATNYLGSRIKAVGFDNKGYRKSITASWDYALSSSQNHAASAAAFHKRFHSDSDQEYFSAYSALNGQTGWMHFVPAQRAHHFG